MTFDEFVNTRQIITNPKKYGKMTCNMTDDTIGYVYAGSCFIEITTDPLLPRFYLMIENRDWMSNDITELERRLYDWYTGEILGWAMGAVHTEKPVHPATKPQPTKPQPTTIDVTPTWTAMLPAMLLVLQNGTPAGHEIMETEFKRMAKAADRYNSLMRGQ